MSADGEAWAIPVEGAPLETDSFDVFVRHLSGQHESNTGVVPGFLQDPSGFHGASTVDRLCADTGCLDTLSREIREAPEEEILQPGAVAHVVVSNDMAEKGDSETVDMPVLLRPVPNAPGNIRTDVAGFKGLETTGGGLVSGVTRSPQMEGIPGATLETENCDSPVPGRLRPDDVPPLMGRHGLSGAKNSDSSPGMTMILPIVEKEKDSKAVLLSRAIRTGAETSEKVPTRGAILPNGPDVFRIFPPTRDRGQPTSSDGNKPGIQNLLLEPSGVQKNTNPLSVKLNVPVSGAIQKSDSETLIQAEKMIWPLAGPNGTMISEKGDVMEISRLQLEPRGIHTLADIIEKAVWRQENGASQARIQLKPSFMGNLHLNVITNQLKVTVEIRAETLISRDFLEMNLHVLKAELQESGLEVEKIDVLVDTNLNNQQEQGRTSAHKQAHRVNGNSKGMDAPEDKELSEPQTIRLSGGEDKRVDCFV